MKKKQLEIMLQQVPVFQNPKPDLEQYLTPAPIAADILFIALGFDDITEKKVVDLGCGTGIFAIGAAFLQAKEIIGVDVDENCIQQAESFAISHHLPVSFRVNDISNLSATADTVITNPPFGAQKSNKHADRFFLKKAFTIAPVVYSLHLTHTLPFIEKLITALGAKITFEKAYPFSIKAMFSFHRKMVDRFQVSVIRSVKK